MEVVKHALIVKVVQGETRGWAGQPVPGGQAG